MADDGFDKIKRPCGILNRKNKDKWFRLMKQHFIANKLWNIIESPPILASNASTPSSVSGSIFGFGSPEDNAKVMYTITICISDDDQEDMAEKTTASALWHALVEKYKEKLQTTGRKIVQQLSTFKLGPGMTIEEAWTWISKKAREVAATQPDLAAFAKESRRLQILLASLPSEYSVIRDAIDAQVNPDPQIAIQKLQEKEAQLADTETAMWAKHNERDHPRPRRNARRSDSDSSDNDRRRSSSRFETRCYLCKGKHVAKDCKWMKRFHIFMEQEKEKERRKDKRSSSKSKEHRHKHTKKHRAYHAEGDSTSDDVSNSSDSEEEDAGEIAALSKEEVSQIPRDTWIADTGASSHMTDQLRHFRGPLSKIRRRTIKVGGGKLYSDQCGTAIMRAKDGHKAPLASTLYVPHLGVNLLAGRRMCGKGLSGGFDKHSLWMHDKSGRQVLKARQQGGVYVVDEIAEDLNEFALITAIKRKADMALSAQSNQVDSYSEFDESINKSANKSVDKSANTSVDESADRSTESGQIDVQSTEVIVDPMVESSSQSWPSNAAPKGNVQTMLHVAIPKRKRDDVNIEQDRDEHRDKIARAMMALLAQDPDDTTANDEWAMLSKESSATSFVDKVVIPVPKTYKEAIEDPIWGELWKEAIKAELTALIANGTWETVTPPKDANIVTSKWVFKAKMHIDGTLDKLKARLVARGFSQMFGIDYEDTFAPTIRFDTLRLFLVLVALEDLECHQVDVNNAFTESFLKEVIYMAPPPGVELPPGQALRILRSLYGLKQAARDWHERCVKELRKLGFQQCSADPCLLTHSTRSIMLLLYVDDVGIASKSIHDVNWFKDEFKRIFKIKDLGEMSKILGIRITRDRKNRTLRMDQTHYLEEVLDRLHMKKDKHAPTTLPMNGYDSLRPAGLKDERIDQRDYQHAIGSIMYAAIHTRPDIAFAVGRLSQYLSDPAKHHGQALKSLLKYLRSTIDKGIVYGSSGSSNLVGYSDSDYATDKLDRKSILGYVYMLGGGPISWISRKQKSVATSTTEAEYMALSTCAKEGLWIIQLLKDMGYTKYLGDDLNRVSIVEDVNHEANSPAQLKGDNQAALTLVKDAHIHERSKHIDVAYHHVRDLHQRNLIQVAFVPSAEMVADGLTKPLPRDKYNEFIKQLGLEGPKAGKDIQMR